MRRPGPEISRNGWRFRSGWAPGGTPPTGYRAERIEDGSKRDGQPRLVAKWVVDEEKAEQAEQAFAMCAAGCSYNAIHAATDLLRTKQSNWSMSCNRVYRGILKLGAEEFPGALPALGGRGDVCGGAGPVDASARGGREGAPAGIEVPAVRTPGVLTSENFQRLLAKMRTALAALTVTDALRWLEGEMRLLRRAESICADVRLRTARDLGSRAGFGGVYSATDSTPKGVRFLR